MKIYELDFIQKSDLHKLGKLANMSIGEFVNWCDHQKTYGRKTPKFFNNIYDRIVTESRASSISEDADSVGIYKSAIDSEPAIMEIMYFPVSIDKEAGLFNNLKNAFIEIGDELSKRVGNRKYHDPLSYTSAPNETFPLELVAKILTKVYGENKTINETSEVLGYGREHIRNVHSKTVNALIRGNTISQNICLNPDLITWSKLVGEEYVMCTESDFVDIAGSCDERELNVLGLDAVSIDNTNIRFIIPKRNKGTYTKVGETVIAVLRDNILPLSREEIFEQVEHHDKMKKVEDYDVTFIENILSCEDLIDSDNGQFWLKTQYLTTDQQKMARLIYDEKRPVSSRDALTKFEAIYKRSISLSLTALRRYGLRKLYGNIWDYRDDESELPPLQTFIDKYALDKKIFYYSELKSALEAAGYVITPSVRSYITNCCQVDNNDKNHFCYKKFVDDYTDFSWRSQSRAGVTNWILNKIKDGIGHEDEIPVKSLYNYVQKEAEGTIFEPRIRCRIKSILDKYCGAGQPFLLNDGILHKNIAIFDTFDFSIEGLKGGKYPFFIQIRSIILNALKKSFDGRITLVDAIKLINECVDVPQTRSTIISAINNRHLPKLSVTLENTGGVLYIVKTKEDLPSEPIYEIKSTADPDKAEIVVAADSIDRRPDISYRLALDWRELETALIRELSFYRSWMSSEHIDFENAVVKFIRFIQIAQNRNLSSKLPQSLYEYWFARTDSHDRETYVSQLSIFFEGLLSEIKYQRDGIRLRKMGLGDWMNEFDGLSKVLKLSPYEAKGFDKLYKDLYFKRNKIAHGEMVEMSSATTAKTISDYVALYIFTVAKYA